MDPQQVIDGVWVTTGATVSAAFIGIIFGLIQIYVPNNILDTNNTTVRNWVIGVLCAALVGVAAWQIGQTGVQPNPANVIGAIIAFAGLFRLSVGIHTDTLNTVAKA